jgi:hypothetical protein
MLTYFFQAHSAWQRAKQIVADLFWICSLTMVFNSDKLASLIETVVYQEPGDNSFSNFLNQYPVLRNAWNVLVAEIWIMLLSLMLSFGYHTETQKNSAFLIRYYFLLFMSLYIVPIFNVDSFYTLVREYIYGGDLELQWNCIFLADNGAYYINNMTIMALFGTGLTLLRWRSLLFQAYIFLTSRSKSGRRHS